MLSFALITVSDRGYRRERADENRLIVEDYIRSLGGELVRYDLVPDEFEMIRESLIFCSDALRVNFVLTNGGTGLSPRDVTPEATRAVCDKEIPGIPELMRYEGFKKTKKAALSRQYAGLRGRTVIINLPGTPSGTRDCLEAVAEILPHIAEVQAFLPHPGERAAGEMSPGGAP